MRREPAWNVLGIVGQERNGGEQESCAGILRGLGGFSGKRDEAVGGSPARKGCDLTQALSGFVRGAGESEPSAVTVWARDKSGFHWG